MKIEAQVTPSRLRRTRGGASLYPLCRMLFVYRQRGLMRKTFTPHHPYEWDLTYE